MPRESFAEFCYRQRQRVSKRLQVAEQRIQRARRRDRQAVHDEWHVSTPGTVGHAIGGRRPTLDDLER